MDNYRIDKNKFYELVKNGYKVVDVRSKGEDLATGFVYKNSLNIPYPKVIDLSKKYFPDYNEKIIFICNYGQRSGLSAKAYRQKGYKNAFVLDMGLSNL